MAFIPTASTIKYDMLLEEFGQQVVNEFWVKVGVPITSALITTISDALRNWFIVELLPLLSQRLTGTTIRGTDQSSSVGASVLKVYTSNSGGVAEGTGQPSGVALAVTKRTANRGRSFRGRNYLAGIPLSALVSGDADTVTPTFTGNVLSKYALLDSNYLIPAEPTAFSVVASHFANKLPRVAGVATPITAYQVNDKIDSQRRRLSGRGA